MLTAKEISEKLAHDAEAVARHLLPAGKRAGGEWETGDTSGSQGRSCKVRLTGGKAGRWSDFATGECGDLLDLWCRARGVNLSVAISEAKRFLGVQDPQWEGYRKQSFTRPEKPKCSRSKPETASWKYLTEFRKLSPEAIDAYRIAEQPGKLVFPYLREGELVFVKYLDLARPDGKKLCRVEKDCEPCLFGWQAISDNAREVTLCEGEIDAATLWQYGFPALSVPFGGGKGEKQRWIEFEFERLSRFDTVYLCFDNDPEGALAVAEVSARLGRHRCKVVQLPEKDANECLQKGVAQSEIEICFQNAKTQDPKELKSAADFVEDVIRTFYPPENSPSGFSPPWGRWKGKVQFRPGELSIWSGINGHGKSQALGQVMLEAMDQGERVCIASLELKPRILLMRMTRQTSGLFQPSIPYIRAVHDWYSDKLWLFDVVGSTKGESILEIFKYAKQRYGVTQFVIDSLMKCGMGEDDYNAQKLFVERLADFKNEFDVHVHLVAHARKGESEEKMPGKLDIKGTGTITDLVDNSFIIWRNKRKEEELQKAEAGYYTPKQDVLDEPDAIIKCDKQRNGDWEGKINLWWKSDAYQLVDHASANPRRYVDYRMPQGSRLDPPIQSAVDILGATVEAAQPKRLIFGEKKR